MDEIIWDYEHKDRPGYNPLARPVIHCLLCNRELSNWEYSVTHILPYCVTCRIELNKRHRESDDQQEPTP